MKKLLSQKFTVEELESVLREIAEGDVNEVTGEAGEADAKDFIHSYIEYYDEGTELTVADFLRDIMILHSLTLSRRR